ncbi:hypothetical protein HYPSUDRAFT_71621 [Hypholoma sublateritium FD-334 SS-4]|uniref:AB hydrolase-1 domain-containing protein n=1 Tax=Hypholoma sublateritium (strain FD-334 SS-4) TaxID=945553 RepID=A0A0D2LYY4_HYPSF|nr:hypothetical protein HYPSUDRAFT_71621 [Hypholoma sublateritium FD-334 SS-4]
MLSESYVIDPTPEYPLFLVAKRYWVPEFERHAANPAAMTLIVLHSTSFHKETWEPALEDLFALAAQPRSTAPIREAWAIDCPNHGEAGARNHDTLRGPDFVEFSCEKYAQAVHRFLSAHPSAAFKRRRLVGIGHSLGANAMILLQDVQPLFAFSTLIIVEPMLSAGGAEHLAPLRNKLVGRARKRTKCWTSLAEARRDYSQRGRHGAKWDPRVLDLFIRFDISCMREQEVAMYMDTEGAIKPVSILDVICRHIPIHIALGGKSDLIPPHVHPALVDPKSGRVFASVTTIAGVGHLIPQEVPKALAAYIFTVLAGDIPILPRL